ncbi:MAG TPA: extracellular solute-binding protein, partial [Candidatus Ozemobacteraceae bacterium]|nr:extracellular solute-binding protein [Candidatus Ozemobacteraceae bacterium]
MILSPSRKIRTGLIAAIAAAGRRGPAAVLLCLLLLVPALFTAGCGSSGKKAASGSGDLPNLGKARLKLWNTMTPTESEAFASVLTEFKIKYPDIEIDVENVAFSQARAKYEQATKTGTGPDIFRSDRFWLKDFAKQSIVEPFDTAGMEEELDDLLPLAR